MPLDENELLVRFEPDAERLAFYRIVRGTPEREQLMFVTEFKLSKLKALPVEQAEHKLGKFLAWIFAGMRRSLYRELNQGDS